MKIHGLKMSAFFSSIHVIVARYSLFMAVNKNLVILRKYNKKGEIGEN